MKSISVRLIALSFALLLPSCPQVILGEDYAVQAVGPFGGANNIDNPMTIPGNMAQDLLNVEITPNGKSVKKREGYAQAFQLAIASSAGHGVYNFYESGGSDVSLFFNDRRMASSVGGGAITTLISTGTLAATYQCTDSQGFAYCANTARNFVVKTNGVSFTLVSNVNSTGTMVTVTPEQLVMAGFSDAPNRIDFSKRNDFNTWLVDGTATGPNQITVVAPGAKISHITYAHGRVYWFKDSSFGFILTGPTLGDWKVVTLSQNLGTLDNTSVYWNDVLYFRGQDAHIYSFDGANLEKLTRDIGTTIAASQTRRSSSWIQTTQTDFASSSITPSGYLSVTVTPGSVVLDTATAVASFADTSSTDFGSSTASYSGVSTYTTLGSIELLYESTATFDSAAGTGSSELIRVAPFSCGTYSLYQKFLATSTYYATSATMNLSRDAGYSGNLTVTLGSVSGTIANAAIGTSEGIVSVIFTSSIPLISGTTYTFTLTPTDTSVSGSGVYWHYGTAGSPYSLGSADLQSSACPPATFCCEDPFFFISEVTTRRYAFQIKGIQYKTSGTFLSRSFDVGFTTNSWLWAWGTLSATSNLNGGTLSYETQTSSDTTNWDGLVSVVSGNSVTSVVKRYIRYKSTFAISAGTATPRLHDVTITNGSRLRPSATFYSQVNNAPNITTWDSLGATYQDNGGTNSFSIRASQNWFSIASSTPSWTAIAPGQVPSISTGAYFQLRDIFTATASTQNPKLDDFTFNWFEGQAGDKAYASYFNDAVWWSVASGTGASTNNYILRYDLITPGWTIYDIPTNGMLTRNLHLYFIGASTGVVYRFGDVDNDNGAAINAYWKSKDYFLGSPFTENDFVNMSVSAASISNSSATLTYTINGSSSTSYTVPMYSGSALSSFTRNNKNLPQGKIGSTINVKFGNSAADQPFEIFGVQFGYRPKSWIPTP